VSAAAARAWLHALTLPCLRAQDLREKIDQHYRVRLILDNLPITTYDLAENPESIRPGYEVGYERDGRYFLNNHLMFKILVHKTNGQYTRARENMAEIEAAAVIEARPRVWISSSACCAGGILGGGSRRTARARIGLGLPHVHFYGPEAEKGAWRVRRGGARRAQLARHAQRAGWPAQGGARRRLAGAARRDLADAAPAEDAETKALREAAERRAGGGELSMYMVVGFEARAPPRL